MKTLFRWGAALAFTMALLGPGTAAAQGTSATSPDCLLVGAAANCTYNMQYQGGPVMTGNTTVYTIWYGDWSGTPNAQSAVAGLLGNLTGSPYMNLASLYGASTTISYGGAVNITSANSAAQGWLGTNVSDSGLASILNDQLANGTLPRSTAAIYAIFTAPGVTEQESNLACSFHANAGNLVYGWINGIQQGCGNGVRPADDLTANTTHLLFNALTDPQLGNATATSGPPLGWLDTNLQAEVADPCAFHQDAVTLGSGTYTVQQIFVNVPSLSHGGACVTSWSQATGPVGAVPELSTPKMSVLGLVTFGLIHARRRRSRDAAPRARFSRR